MFSLSLECALEDRDSLTAELLEAGTIGTLDEDLPEGRCRLVAYFADAAESSALVLRFARWSAAVERVEERDWVAESRALWEPLEIGERFFLAPAWHDGATPAGRIRLEMPTGTVSGTGLHPTTQLALEGLERLVRPGDLVLDVGTGSGILARGAALLAAGAVIRCDIDPDAVCDFVGSVRSVRSGAVDLVVANINAAELVSLAADIPRALKPEGRAILTGFTEAQADCLRNRFTWDSRPSNNRVSNGESRSGSTWQKPAGRLVRRMRLLDTLRKAEWRCLILEADGA